MSFRPLVIAAFAFSFLLAPGSNAGNWAELLEQFFGTSPRNVEQILQEEAQRRWQTVTANLNGRISRLTRRLSERVLGVIVTDGRRQSPTNSPRDAAIAPSNSSPTAAGSPRSRESSPRTNSSPRISLNGATGGSPRNIPRVLANTQIATLPMVAAIWTRVLQFLGPRDLRRASQLNHFLHALVGGNQDESIQVWVDAYRRNGVIETPMPAQEAARLLRQADGMLHRLLFAEAPLPLVRDIPPPEVAPHASTLHEIIVQAVRAGAPLRLLRHDPFVTFAELRLARHQEEQFVFPAMAAARAWLNLPCGPADLYRDMHQLANEGFEEAQELVVLALVDGRLSLEDRPLAERTVELISLATRGWPAAQQIVIQDLVHSSALTPAQRDAQIMRYAQRGWLAAQNHVVDEAFRNRAHFGSFQAWANQGWPRAQHYVVLELLDGVFGHDTRPLSERVRDLETNAANGWVEAQEYLSVRAVLQQVCFNQEDSPRINYDRGAILCELALGRRAIPPLRVSQLFLQGSSSGSLRSISASDALYALAARGWIGAQNLVIAEAQRLDRIREPHTRTQPSRAQLLRWYFDLIKLLRGDEIPLS